MIESHINAGAQKFTPWQRDDASALEYGKSITDACLGWDDSLVALAELSAAVQAPAPLALRWLAGAMCRQEKNKAIAF